MGYQPQACPQKLEDHPMSAVWYSDAPCLKAVSSLALVPTSGVPKLISSQ
jgi:hypothetical protein